MRLSLLVFFLFTIQAHAVVKVKIVEAVKNDIFDLGVGSKARLLFPDQTENTESIFLGRMVGDPDNNDEFLFLDLAKTRIYMIDVTNVSKKIADAKTQSILAPVEQSGNTCAAYAILHFWWQMSVTGLGTDKLNEVMSKERPKMKLLEETIERYYLGRSPDTHPILVNYGKRFDYRCKQYEFKKSSEAVDFVFGEALKGHPIIMEFNLASDMLTSTYEVYDYESRGLRDPRLWIPRQIGQRTTGGHSIVAAAGFIAKGRKKIVVIDSDWAEPRIWDIEKYLSSKTAIKSMIFHSCEKKVFN